jgi:hypothetical protein
LWLWLAEDSCTVLLGRATEGIINMAASMSALGLALGASILTISIAQTAGTDSPTGQPTSQPTALTDDILGTFSININASYAIIIAVLGFIALSLIAVLISIFLQITRMKKLRGTYEPVPSQGAVEMTARQPPPAARSNVQQRPAPQPAQQQLPRPANPQYRPVPNQGQQQQQYNRR